MKGPGIFLAQFAGNEPPFNSLERMGEWAAGLGYKGVQVPTSDPGLFDLQVAASSQAYCDDIKGRLAQYGVEITELSTHLQGQLLAVHPAYVDLFRGFADPAVRDQPAAWPEWATQQLKFAARASERLGLQGPCDVLRRAAVAHDVPVAAATAGPGRSRVHRTGATLAAGAGCLWRCRGRPGL